MSSKPIVLPARVSSRGADFPGSRRVSSSGLTKTVGIFTPRGEKRRGDTETRGTEMPHSPRLPVSPTCLHNRISYHLAPARPCRPAADHRRELACGSPSDDHPDLLGF